jgi:iron(III) transport system permease protein
MKQNFAERVGNRKAAAFAIAALVIALVAILAFGTGQTSQLLRTTALLVFGTLAIALPIGVLLAVLIVRTDLPGRRFAAIVLGVMLLVPLYLQTGAWQAGFGLQGWFSIVTGTELLNNMRGAIWVHATAAIPWVALIVGVGLRMVEPELEEEARLYASNARVLVHVTLRRASPAVAIAAMWVAVTVAGEMTVTDLFRVRTTAEEVYLALAATSDMQAASLEVLPHAVVVAVALLLGGACCFRLMPRARTISLRPAHLFALGKWRIALAALVAPIMAVLIAVPLTGLVYKAGLESVAVPGGSFQQSWSANKLYQMVIGQSWKQFGDEAVSSVIVGAIAATSAVAAGVLLAWIGRSGAKRAALVCVVAAVLFALPGPLIGAGVSRIVTHMPIIYDSYAAPSIAIALRVLPIVLLVCWHAVRLVPDAAIDAARVEGAGHWACLTKVVLPISYPAIVAAWLVAFVVSVGDLSASQLLQLPGRETLAARVFDRLHSGAYDQVCGLFLVLLAAVAVVAAMVLILFWWARRRSQWNSK